jgi:hypothetical protein
MKCAELEILLCDYVDQTLSAPERATVELHLAACPACRALVEDSREALDFIGIAAAVEAPPALVNAILYEARQGLQAPTRQHAPSTWLGRLFEPILRPKFAMGMMMTLLSFSMLARFAGIPIRQLRPADLEPARVWATLEDKAYRTWDRAHKYYESLRLVYEMQQTLRDWSGTDESRPATGADAPARPRPDGTALDGPIELKTPSESAKKKTDGRVRQ